MTTSKDVYRGLQGLAPPANDATFSAARVEGHEWARVALAAGARIAILMPVDPASSQVDVHLRHFRARMRAVVNVVDENGRATVEEVALLEFDGPLFEDLEYLSMLAGSVLDSLEVDSAPGALEKVVLALSETFQPRRRSRSSALGLWGELVFALQSEKPDQSLRAWHSEKSATHDFAFEGRRVEVKTTEGPGRVHSFELRQLAESAGLDVDVASIVTTRTDFGSSVADLVLDLDEALSAWPDLRLKLFQLVAATLGEDWRAVTEELRWDRVEGESSLRILKASVIPTIDISLEPLIVDARIRVDVEPLVASAQD